MFGPKYKFKDNQYQYNQAGLDDQGCTFIAGITAISNNYNLKLNDTQIKQLLIHRPKMVSGGSNMGVALGKLPGLINPTYGKNIKMKAIDLVTQFHYLKWGYIACISGKINASYLSDVKDGSWDDTYLTKLLDTSHARCLYFDGVDAYIIENYFGMLPFNVFKVKNLKALIDKGLIKRQAFIFMGN